MLANHSIVVPPATIFLSNLRDNSSKQKVSTIATERGFSTDISTKGQARSIIVVPHVASTSGRSPRNLLIAGIAERRRGS